MRVDFYHLTSLPLERALPRIAERLLESGERLLVVVADDDRRAALDRALWQYRDEGFLPHDQAGGANDAEQPVLLSPEPSSVNSARNIALADGQWRDDALTFDRAFHFFDESSIAAARDAWKALADRDGVERNYWRQNEDGRWEKMA